MSVGVPAFPGIPAIASISAVASIPSIAGVAVIACVPSGTGFLTREVSVVDGVHASYPCGRYTFVLLSLASLLVADVVLQS
jgi:hypothetical protein